MPSTLVGFVDSWVWSAAVVARVVDHGPVDSSSAVLEARHAVDLRTSSASVARRGSVYAGAPRGLESSPLSVGLAHVALPRPSDARCT